MDELNHWRLFINSGSALDYIAYKRAQEMKDTGAGAPEREETDEVPHRGFDYQGAEYS